MFSKEFEVSDTVPRMIQQLIGRQTIELGDNGVTIEWHGVNRRINITDDSLEFEPPCTVRLAKKWATFTTSLWSMQVSNNGKTIRCKLDGCDFTIRLKTQGQ